MKVELCCVIPRQPFSARVWYTFPYFINVSLWDCFLVALRTWIEIFLIFVIFFIKRAIIWQSRLILESFISFRQFFWPFLTFVTLPSVFTFRVELHIHYSYLHYRYDLRLSPPRFRGLVSILRLILNESEPHQPFLFKNLNSSSFCPTYSNYKLLNSHRNYLA